MKPHWDGPKIIAKAIYIEKNKMSYSLVWREHWITKFSQGNASMRQQETVGEVPYPSSGSPWRRVHAAAPRPLDHRHVAPRFTPCRGGAPHTLTPPAGAMTEEYQKTISGVSEKGAWRSRPAPWQRAPWWSRGLRHPLRQEFRGSTNRHYRDHCRAR
jgi:hypothetical protein